MIDLFQSSGSVIFKVSKLEFIDQRWAISSIFAFQPDTHYSKNVYYSSLTHDFLKATNFSKFFQIFRIKNFD